MHPASCMTRIHSIPSFSSLTTLSSFQPIPTPDPSIKLESETPHPSSYIPISPSAPSSYLPLHLPDAQPPLYADPYLSTSYGTELGIVTDGAREYGVATLNFDLEYRWPTVPPELADFLLAHTDWYVHPGDDRVDMISQVNFDQE